jgi:hypothetical protein
MALGVVPPVLGVLGTGRIAAGLDCSSHTLLNLGCLMYVLELIAAVALLARRQTRMAGMGLAVMLVVGPVVYAANWIRVELGPLPDPSQCISQ